MSRKRIGPSTGTTIGSRLQRSMLNPTGLSHEQPAGSLVVATDAHHQFQAGIRVASRRFEQNRTVILECLLRIILVEAIAIESSCIRMQRLLPVGC